MKSILVQEVEYYLSKYSSPKDPLLEKMEIFALKNKIPILESSSAQFLEYLLYLNKPKRFLEIGTAIGYSTIRINGEKADRIGRNLKLEKCI